MNGKEKARYPYEKPTVRVYESSDILEMLGPAQGFGSGGGGRPGLSSDPFSSVIDSAGGTSQFDRNR